MKRLTTILIISLLMLSICLPVMADTNETQPDLFYFAKDDKILANAIDRCREKMIENDKQYICAYVLKENETIDENKITHGFDEVFAKIEWNSAYYLEFLETENKLEFLRNCKISYYAFPLYYNGELVKDFHEVYSQDGTDMLVFENSHMFENGVQVGDYSPIPFVFNKKELIDELAKQGITGYDILHSANIDALGLLLAQKDGQQYVILYPHEGFYTRRWCKFFYEKEKELIDKKVLTMSEAKQLFRSGIEHEEEYKRNNALSDVDGGGGATTEKAPSSEKSPFSLWAVVIAIVAAVAAAGTAVIIVIKKKKA